MSPYRRGIDREHKALFVFLLDQSYSMEEKLRNSDNRKKDELADAINGWLENMAIKASKEEGIRDWMDVAVIGYRTDRDANPIIESALLNVPAEKRGEREEMVKSIVEIGNDLARVDKKMQKLVDGESGEVIEIPVDVRVWVDPKAEHGTPMCSVLVRAWEIVSEWIEQHRDSFPPVVIHITDGESAEEGELNEYADAIKDLETDDGNVLLFNCHLSKAQAESVMFPVSDELLPDDLARKLFQMSSVFPEEMRAIAVADGFDVAPGARGMAFNADMACLLNFLDFGTKINTELR